MGSEFGDGRRNSSVLPDDRVVNSFAGFLVPDDCGFALVGDPDRGQIARAEATGLHCFLNYGLRAPPDFCGIVFHPARLEINLLVLFLRGADDATRTVEDDE